MERSRNTRTQETTWCARAPPQGVQAAGRVRFFRQVPARVGSLWAIFSQFTYFEHCWFPQWIKQLLMSIYSNIRSLAFIMLINESSDGQIGR